MNTSSQPYLTHLKSAFAGVAATAASNPAWAQQQSAVASRLLDHLSVQVSLLPNLKARCYAALKALVPEIEKLLGERPAYGALLNSADAHVFDELLRQTSEIQQDLLRFGSDDALRVCRAIVALEADYNREFNAAVAARNAEVVAAAGASTARNAREYDESALLDFIRHSFPEETDLGIARTALVSGGYSKFTLGISLTGAKSLPAEIVLRGDGSAAFGGVSVVDEYRLIRMVFEHGVCVPRPLAVETTGKVFGSPFLLVERRPSTVIGHQFCQPSPNKAVCDDIAAKLAAVHRVPLAAVGDQISGANCSSSQKVVEWLDAAYGAWKPLDMPSAIFETAFEWLRRHAHINDRALRTLVHGDFVLNNILIHDNKVSAILDWEFSHVGNPAYDLGYSFFMGSALSSWEDYLAAYGRAGMPVPDDDQLNYHILLAATRLGTMICQVVRSFTSGQETGIAGAAVVGDNYYEEMIRRISVGLNRVL